MIRMLGKCTVCGAKVTRVADKGDMVAGTQYFVLDGVCVGKQHAGESAHARAKVACACGRSRVLVSSVRGTVTKTKCGPKCWDAEGDCLHCKCACGGLNHGAGADFIGING